MIPVQAEQVRRWMQGFTYKPDWEFNVRHEWHMDSITIEVRCALPNVNSVRDFNEMTLIPKPPENMFYDGYTSSIRRDPYSFPIPIEYADVIGSLTVPPFVLTRYAFYQWLLGQGIPYIERHETLEWGRLNGRLIFDPHPNGGSSSNPSNLNYLLKDGDQYG